MGKIFGVISPCSFLSPVFCPVYSSCPNARLHHLNARRPMGSAWVLVPVLHLGNYLKTINCSNHRTLLICFLSLKMIVLPCLNFSILKTFASYILFFFCLFQAGSPCYSNLARSRTPCHHNSFYPLLMK